MLSCDDAAVAVAVAVAWRPAAFKGEVTGSDDWFGERTEDSTHHSVVTEARPYYERHRQTVVGHQSAPINDHDQSASTTPETYLDLTMSFQFTQRRQS